MIKFAERLRELRREKKVTQSKMADFLGIKLRSYQNYEAALAGRITRDWWPWRITST